MHDRWYSRIGRRRTACDADQSGREGDPTSKGASGNLDAAKRQRRQERKRIASRGVPPWAPLGVTGWISAPCWASTEERRPHRYVRALRFTPASDVYCICRSAISEDRLEKRDGCCEVSKT